VPSWPRRFSPLYRWAKVSAACVQAALRKVFRRWGCPGCLRVDNGIPWGNASGLPSELSLWLAGLGVWMHSNDPYRPQQNGVVERSQGTTQRWVDPASCGDIDELRRRVEHEDKIQREVYPAIEGRSRYQANPGLMHTGRGYCEGWEKFAWDVQEALRWLGRYRVRRKVSRRGQISLYHRLIQVSAEYGGRWVYAQMDAEALEWVISDSEGKEIRRRPAPQFTAEAIIALDVARA
jgi:hypothetical protein